MSIAKLRYSASVTITGRYMVSGCYFDMLCRTDVSLHGVCLYRNANPGRLLRTKMAATAAFVMKMAWLSAPKWIVQNSNNRLFKIGLSLQVLFCVA